MATQDNAQFLTVNESVFHRLGVDVDRIASVSPTDSLAITQAALAARMGKFRAQSQLMQMAGVVARNFQDPQISAGFEAVDGTIYRQTYPYVATTGLPLMEQGLVTMLRQGVDAVTRVMTMAGKVALEQGFVHNRPNMFLDGPRRAIWQLMFERRIGIPPTLLLAPTLFSRFDVVLDESGRPWLVDATMQSGGIDVAGFAADLWQRRAFTQTTAPTRLYRPNWSLFANRLRQEIGPWVTIIGGSGVRNYAQEQLGRYGITPLATIPTRKARAQFGEYEDLTNSQVLGATAFWWGTEHVDNQPLREALLRLLGKIAEGEVRSLNHPIVMAVNESKATLALLQVPGCYYDKVSALVGKHLVDEVLTFIPARKLLRVSTRKGKIRIAVVTATKSPGELVLIDVGEAATETELHAVLNELLPGEIFLKPVAGLGARGIVDLTALSGAKDVWQALLGPKEVWYVAEPTVPSIEIAVEKSPGGPLVRSIPRVEVYTSTVRDAGRVRDKDHVCDSGQVCGEDQVRAGLAFAVMMFNPGKPDRKIHAASGAVIVPVGLPNPSV